MPVHDLNAALVSYLVTGYEGFTSAAGHIGRKYRVDHDISLLVPEVWSRMFIHEREPDYLIRHEYLEKIEDFEHNGKTSEASRLGYRITQNFVNIFFGRIFSAADTVFSEDMLRPELQSMDDFIDGLDNIIETQRSVALNYFKDGGIEAACPPLKALLHIMAYGKYEEKDLHHPDIRGLFTREAMLASDWYKARLDAKVKVDQSLWERHVEYLENFLAKPNYQSELRRLRIQERLDKAKTYSSYVHSPAYRESLIGMIGTDPELV